MKREDLFNKVTAVKSETQAALQLVFDGLNNGQQKKLLKNEKIKALFNRYNVIYE